MEIIKILEVVKNFFGQYIRPVHKITHVLKSDKGWELSVEVIEEKEYMKAHAKDELIGVYSVLLSPELEIVSFQRKSLRARGAILHE
ncbi:gas vesicle protein GvpO [Gottfriedia acidiceleris]|uniref:gas vesicle protein GvpO n=1 Tax=Gottfriedia acidiceleris TaxID=371036 RepID=UPI000B43F04C|nr:gas vesicle protein GvpO [Gottfriedia acidiceleris]